MPKFIKERSEESIQLYCWLQENVHTNYGNSNNGLMQQFIKSVDRLVENEANDDDIQRIIDWGHAKILDSSPGIVEVPPRRRKSSILCGLP